MHVMTLGWANGCRRGVGRQRLVNGVSVLWLGALLSLGACTSASDVVDHRPDSGSTSSDGGVTDNPASDTDEQADAASALPAEVGGDGAPPETQDAGYMLSDAGHGPDDTHMSPPEFPQDGGAEEPPAAACQPTGAGPYRLLEQEAVSIQVSCASGLAVPLTLVIAPLPSGALYDAATGTLTWTPGLDQAAHYALTLTAGPGDTGVIDVFVIDRFDAPNNVPVQDATQYLEEYGLPVMHLTTDPGLNDDEYTPATITYRGHTYVGAEAKNRGATSANYPKRSYTLKFTKQDKFSEPDKAGGFNEKRKIVLITSFDDNSYLRQRMGFELWNRLGDEHIRVQSYNAVLFLNGEYYGLYTIADHVDEYLMEDFGLAQEGNLFKARTHNANFRATLQESKGPDGALLRKGSLHDGYTKEEGTPEEGQPGAFDDLDAFVGWVASSSASNFASELDSKLVRKDYEDWWIFSSFIMADDSAGKNSYHYHDPALAGSLWRFVPWDLNQSFGQDWLTQRVTAQQTAPEGYYVTMNGLFERMLADASIGHEMRERYEQALRDVYGLEQLLPLFDAMAQEIERSAKRDESKWSSAYRSYVSWGWRSDFTTFDSEVQYMRQWISDRHAYIGTLY